MLSINRLGNLGRLANQMFQYASLKGIATNRGYSFSIPPKDAFGVQDELVSQSDVTIYDVFKNVEKNEIGFQNNQTLWERMHQFDEELFVNCPDNVDLVGYFQTEKYFKHIEDDIRKDFSFSTDITETCKELYDSIIGDKESISLHIRRGDYTVNPNHPTQSIEYYEKALSKFDAKIPVIVFSDDPSWCHQQELFSDDRFMISDENTTEFDLCLMSLCTYHIIANSSFSWWGAWLAKSKKIIAPKNWFSAECSNKSIQDVPFGDFTFL